MKYPIYFVAAIVSALALGGCGAPANETTSPEQRAQLQSSSTKNMPPQAQALAAQQNQQKSQMDAARAKSAAAAPKP